MLKKRHVAMGTGVCIQSMDDEGARGIDGIPNTFAAVSRSRLPGHRDVVAGRPCVKGIF
jgi:hypothetical protein